MTLLLLVRLFIEFLMFQVSSSDSDGGEKENEESRISQASAPVSQVPEKPVEQAEENLFQSALKEHTQK